MPPVVPALADDSHDTTPLGDQPYHQSSTVLRVLLGTSPSSALGWRLLRPLHTTCSTGRTAALRTIQHLPLDRAHNQGLPYTRQLDVLAAADQAIALTIHSEQIQGLLESLEQQHQLAANVAALEATLNTILAMEGSCRGAPYLAANSTSTSTTSSSAVITTTTTSCSKGVNTAGAASTQPFLQTSPAVTPRGPQFGHITVDGELTRAAVQQLVKLLDVLPGTQHLHTLVLTNVPTGSGLPVDQLYCDKHVRYSKQRLLAPQDALAAALTEPELGSSSNSTSYSLLGDHYMMQLPDGIGQLTALTELSVAGGASLTLTNSMGSLVQLRRLAVSASGPVIPRSAITALTQLASIRVTPVPRDLPYLLAVFVRPRRAPY
jgi:hypothetical protein